MNDVRIFLIVLSIVCAITLMFTINLDYEVRQSNKRIDELEQKISKQDSLPITINNNFPDSIIIKY